MNNRKTILKILIFGIYAIGSIFIGFMWFLNPPIPTKWNEDPYCIDIYDLYKFANVVENEQIVINQGINDYNYSESSDILSILIKDTFHNVQITIQFNNWSKHEKYNIIDIRIGSSYCIKGKSLLISEGIVLGIDIVEIRSYITNILSLAGLAIIVPLIFYYFKIDFKKLKIRKKESSRGS